MFKLLQLHFQLLFLVGTFVSKKCFNLTDKNRPNILAPLSDYFFSSRSSHVWELIAISGFVFVFLSLNGRCLPTCYCWLLLLNQYWSNLGSRNSNFMTVSCCCCYSNSPSTVSVVVGGGLFMRELWSRKKIPQIMTPNYVRRAWKRLCKGKSSNNKK